MDCRRPSNQTVNYGESATINIYPDAQYHIASITDKGNMVTIANPYMIYNVTADHNVVVTFAINTDAPKVISIILPYEFCNFSTTAFILGTDFKSGATVRLEMSGKVIQGNNVVVISKSLIICTFNLRNATIGSYDVVVKNPDGQAGRLIKAFYVGNRWREMCVVGGSH